MQICFLILHYNEIALTEKAVDSILRMNTEGEDGPDIRIVIVDNCSPNGTGSILADKYNTSQSGNIHVVLNNENGGFAKGNNVGYSYIRENMHPDFVVALNNDITFTQTDFPRILERVYNESTPKWTLAGPDVYTPHIRSHISPLSASVKSEEDTRKFISVNIDRIEQFSKKFSFSHYFRYLQDKYQGSLMLAFYNDIRKRCAKGSGEYDAALAHDTPAYDCVLNGACLIFAGDYIDNNDFLFEEKTFLYAEEDFLTYRLLRDDKHIRYCPELKVDHVGEGSSGYGNMNYRQYCDKNIRTIENCNKSFEIYIDSITENK